MHETPDSLNSSRALGARLMAGEALQSMAQDSTPWKSDASITARAAVVQCKESWQVLLRSEHSLLSMQATLRHTRSCPCTSSTWMECPGAMAWALPFTATGRALGATMASQAAMASRWTGTADLALKRLLKIACSGNFTQMLWRPCQQTTPGMAAAPAQEQMVCVWPKVMPQHCCMSLRSAH